MTEPKAHSLGIIVSLILLSLLPLSCGKGDDSGELSGLVPGEYLAVTEYTDDSGWAPFLHIAVGENGEIASVRFDYVSSDGKLKSSDSDYAERMRREVALTPEEYSRELSKRLLQADSLPVEAVSGATESSRKFNVLAEELKERLQEGTTGPLLVTDSTTYTAEDRADSEGWVGRISLEIRGRSIEEVHYDEILRDGDTVVARKSEDQETAVRWTAEDGMKPEEIFSRLGEQLKAEGNPAGVDVIAGATESSQRFRSLAQKALEKRSPVDLVGLQELLE